MIGTMRAVAKRQPMAPCSGRMDMPALPSRTPFLARSLRIDMETSMAEVHKLLRDVGNRSELASRKVTLVTTIVSDLVRSVRWWCTEGEGLLKVAEEARGINVLIGWKADMPQAPNWLACSDIRPPVLLSVLDVFETWHNAPSEACVFFRVRA